MFTCFMGCFFFCLTSRIFISRPSIDPEIIIMFTKTFQKRTYSVAISQPIWKRKTYWKINMSVKSVRKGGTQMIEILLLKNLEEIVDIFSPFFALSKMFIVNNSISKPRIHQNEIAYILTIEYHNNEKYWLHTYTHICHKQYESEKIYKV